MQTPTSPFGRATGAILFALLTLGLGCDGADHPTAPAVEAAKGGSGPTVASVVPDSSRTGVRLDITVNGSGFDQGSVVTLERQGAPASGITTNATTYVTSRKLVADVTIAADADPGKYDVAVTTTGGRKGVGIELFAVVSAGLKPPTNLTAAALSESAIFLAWQDNSSNEASFEIHQSVTGASGTYVLLTTVNLDIESYTSAGLAPLTVYCYKVRAIKSLSPSTASGFTEPACATTLPPPPPAGVVGVWAEETSTAVVTVTWRDGSTDEEGFRIERATSPDGPWAPAGTVGPNVTTWTTDQPDYYRVRAFNVSGDGWPSDPAQVYPAAPTGLALSVIAPGTVEITWRDNSAFEDAFEVWLGSPSWCCPDSGGCDAGYYENPYDEVPANVTIYRTELASNECQSYTLIVMARRGGALSNAAYVGVP